MENKWKYIMWIILGISFFLFIAFTILFFNIINSINTFVNSNNYYNIDTEYLVETYFGIDTHCVVKFQNITYDGICQRDVLEGIGEAINYEYNYQHQVDLLRLCSRLPKPETWNDCKNIMNQDIFAGSFTENTK